MTSKELRALATCRRIVYKEILWRKEEPNSTAPSIADLERVYKALAYIITVEWDSQ